MIRWLILTGIIFAFFAAGGYWVEKSEENRQKKKAIPKRNDFEKKCRYIFSENAEWEYILTGINKEQ